ncbi:MAG: 23S rRNA (uracil(1939)-C(5))-methyltransferase RlmD [Lachnospiraceae bacterium]|nr:23S rRNA (uracil(1939)-C(5))-methyltransferase RlmD [Lachnospiraceae bacterium]
MAIKCIAIDLDRTTLDKEGKLSTGNRKALEAVIAAGVPVIVASGRSFTALPKDILSVPGIEYAVTCNGAAMYHLPSGRCLKRFRMSETAVLKVMQIAAAYDVTYEAFIDGVAYAGREYIEDPVRFGAIPEAVSYVQATRTLQDDIVSFIYENKARLDSMDIIVKEERTKEKLWREIQETTDEVYITSSIKQLIEISDKHCGKKSGVAFFLRELHLKREELAAFGDADNDIDMLRYAGCGIAMENASPNCKSAADFVTRHHDKDGLAYGLTEILHLLPDDKQKKKKPEELEKLCPAAKKCGGCRYMGVTYQEQLHKKQKQVERLLGRYGRIKPIVGMENPMHYRNKVHAVFAFDKKQGILSGIYQEGTHQVVPVETCLIENEQADRIIQTVKRLAKSFKYKAYNEDTGYGLLRHVLIRTGYHSKEVMVVLVLSSPILPSKNHFVKELCKLHPEITTIVVNVNDKKTSMVLGDKQQVIYGKGYIEDSLCEKVFKISPKSFYQVNPVQTEKLYGQAISYAGLTGKEVVIDAYCGIGTIGIAASDKAGKVIGVELNTDAVKDAVSNARRNGAKNVDFYQNDAGKFMLQLAAAKEKIDVVFMDPPRSGSSEEFLDAVIALKPSQIVYISCNPETMARDLQYLSKKEKRYKIEALTPFDMFPYTECIEVCGLIRLQQEKRKDCGNKKRK